MHSTTASEETTQLAVIFFAKGSQKIQEKLLVGRIKAVPTHQDFLLVCGKFRIPITQQKLRQRNP